MGPRERPGGETLVKKPRKPKFRTLPGDPKIDKNRKHEAQKNNEFLHTLKNHFFWQFVRFLRPLALIFRYFEPILAAFFDLFLVISVKSEKPCLAHISALIYGNGALGTWQAPWEADPAPSDERRARCPMLLACRPLPVAFGSRGGARGPPGATFAQFSTLLGRFSRLLGVRFASVSEKT